MAQTTPPAIRAFLQAVRRGETEKDAKRNRWTGVAMHLPESALGG